MEGEDIVILFVIGILVIVSFSGISHAERNQLPDSLLEGVA